MLLVVLEDPYFLISLSFINKRCLFVLTVPIAWAAEQALKCPPDFRVPSHPTDHTMLHFPSLCCYLQGPRHPDDSRVCKAA
jgi:hypothetical protein